MAQWKMFRDNRYYACGTSRVIRYRSHGAAVILVRDNDRVIRRWPQASD